MSLCIISSRAAAICLCMAAAAGCSGKSNGGGDAVSANADLASFTGSWKVAGHIVAPWFTGPGFAPEPDPDILAKTLTISASATTGAAYLTCEEASFEVKALPLAALFEGNVPDPYVAHAALGVTQEQTPTLLEGCTSGGSDKELGFHLVGKDTLLLGFDNIVYQFSRAPAPADAPTATPAPTEASRTQ